MSESVRYIMALLGIPGVGRVAATRLIEHFRNADELLACPHEQLVLRLKGVGRATDIAGEIRHSLHERMRAADGALADLATHHVEALTPLDPDWPTRLDELDRADRPVVLFSHGDRAVLSGRMVALFATPPLSEDASEKSQTALRRILRVRAVPVTGGDTTFDQVVHRVCSSPDHDAPSAIVLPCGLGRISSTLRPIAAAAVRCGGLILSSFEMDHGPFAHDEVERAMVQAAMSGVALFIEPRESGPERHALDWSLKTQRSVFVIGGKDVPSEAHAIVDETGFDWLELALSLTEGNAE